ncbi:MAG: hypothetical protein ACU0CT_02660 [Paracoccaceae bacterium]
MDDYLINRLRYGDNPDGFEASEEITALRARLEAVEKERDEAVAQNDRLWAANHRLVSTADAGFERADEAEACAERAEAALATARRDALGLCRDIAMQALTGDADGRDIYEQIDALANEAETSARGMP